MVYFIFHAMSVFYHSTRRYHNASQHYEYVFFLVSLLKAITEAHDSVDGCLRWRCDQDISHGNFKRVVEQLREAPNKSSVAIPTSEPGTKWKEGAIVEAVGASGVWHWASVVACHDDGTFNVYLYDDHAEGGQEWKNVRPVHLRPRSQHVRPEGIASRAPNDIPRWGGDDGAAFVAAMAAHANSPMISRSVAKSNNEMLKPQSKGNRKKKKKKKKKEKLQSGSRDPKANSDASASDQDSKLSDLLEGEAKVESTFAKTDVQSSAAKVDMRSTDDHPQIAAVWRQSKQRRKPNARRKSAKIRKNASRFGAKIAQKRSKHSLSKDTERPSSGEKQTGVDEATGKSAKTKSKRLFNKNTRPQSAAIKRPQNQSLSKIRCASRPVRYIQQDQVRIKTGQIQHRKMRRCQSEDNVVRLSKSFLSQKNLKEVTCNIPLPPAADNLDSPGDYGKEAKEQTVSVPNSSQNVPEGKPDSLSLVETKKRAPLHEPSRRFTSTPSGCCTTT